MSEVGLDTLPNARVFEELCRELLLAEGCENVRPTSSGPDQGQDTLVDVPTKTVLGVSLATYVVQCKFNLSGTAVGESVIGDVVGYLSLHGATGLLVVTSASFSGTAVTKANAITKDPRHPYQVILWDGAEVLRRVRRFPAIVAKFWYRSGASYQGKPRVDRFPGYDPSELSSTFAVPPRFADSRIETFLKKEATAPFRARLLELAARYLNSPPVVVILNGPTGSGKTLFACALINEFDAPTKAVVSCDEIADEYKLYAHAGSERLHSLLAFLLDVDILIIDDIGYGFPLGADTRPGLAKFLEDLIQTRISEGRPTILTEPHDPPAAELSSYLNWLRSEYGSYACGDYAVKAWTSAEAIKVGRGCSWLGKSWIGEKLEVVERRIGDVEHILRMPAGEFYARRLVQYGGTEMSQAQEAVAHLDHARALLTQYRKHIESLPWWAIRFDNDGASLEVASPWRADEETVNDARSDGSDEADDVD